MVKKNNAADRPRPRYIGPQRVMQTFPEGCCHQRALLLRNILENPLVLHRLEARVNTVIHMRIAVCASTTFTDARTPYEGCPMNFAVSIGPIVSLVAGILILLIPRLLNYIVALYLIVIGLIGLFGVGSIKI